MELGFFDSQLGSLQSHLPGYTKEKMCVEGIVHSISVARCMENVCACHFVRRYRTPNLKIVVPGFVLFFLKKERSLYKLVIIVDTALSGVFRAQK